MISMVDIYDYIERVLNTEERPVYCSREIVPVPEDFPSCFIVETSHYPLTGNVTLDFRDEQIKSNVEVHVYTNDEDGAISHGFDIMKDVEDAMRRLYFRETYCGQIHNLNPSVKHIVGRFTRAIGGADEMPNE